MSDLSPECAPKRTFANASEFMGSRPGTPANGTTGFHNPIRRKPSGHYPNCQASAPCRRLGERQTRDIAAVALVFAVCALPKAIPLSSGLLLPDATISQCSRCRAGT
jgi:hypothetical protein